MRILAIDTSSKILALGISDGKIIGEYNLEAGTRLSGLLIPTITRVTQALGWKMSDIDYLACGLGPGSFTGVRVGMAAIKGLAWSLNKPVAGISSLDILAKNVRDCDSLVIPAVDAKRGLIYGSIYRLKNGVLKRIMPYMLLDPHNFISKVKTKIGSGSRMDVVILGDALSLYKEEFRQQMPSVRILDKDYWSVRAGNIIELALELIRKKDLVSSFELRPIYLYPRDCQIKKREV